MPVATVFKTLSVGPAEIEPGSTALKSGTQPTESTRRFWRTLPLQWCLVSASYPEVYHHL